MRILLLILILLSAVKSHAQEGPTCNLAARMHVLAQRHKTIDDAAIVSPILKNFNSVEPVTDYRADTIYLIELQHGFVELVFAKDDCVVSSIAMPAMVVRALLQSVGNDS